MFCTRLGLSDAVLAESFDAGGVAGTVMTSGYMIVCITVNIYLMYIILFMVEVI